MEIFNELQGTAAPFTSENAQFAHLCEPAAAPVVQGLGSSEQDGSTLPSYADGHQRENFADAHAPRVESWRREELEAIASPEVDRSISQEPTKEELCSTKTKPGKGTSWPPLTFAGGNTGQAMKSAADCLSPRMAVAPKRESTVTVSSEFVDSSAKKYSRFDFLANSIIITDVTTEKGTITVKECSAYEGIF